LIDLTVPFVVLRRISLFLSFFADRPVPFTPAVFSPWSNALH
jgi:hypothetical protein